MKTNLLLRYIVLFFVLVLLQVLIFNHMQFSGYINPYVYILFILLLPIDVNGGFLLISSFILGLTIDMFLDSLGMHAAASLCLAFFRPVVIKLISVRADFEPNTAPSIVNQGLRWIMTYCLLLIFTHHLVLFFLEIFRFDAFFTTLFRVLISTVFSFIFVMLGFFIMGKSSRSRI